MNGWSRLRPNRKCQFAIIHGFWDRNLNKEFIKGLQAIYRDRQIDRDGKIYRSLDLNIVDFELNGNTSLNTDILIEELNVTHLEIDRTHNTTTHTPENRAIEKARPARENPQRTARMAHGIREKTDVDRSYRSQEPLSKDSILGKSVDRIVATPTGTLLLVPGQRITPATVKTAEHWGMLDTLFDAVAQSSCQPFNPDPCDWTDDASSGSEAPNPISSKPEECGIQAIEERRIQNALSKPVSQTLVDRNGEILLQSGERVTPEAIDRARRSGILDILFGAVRPEEPDTIEIAVDVNC